ncbi:hypothetical protein [Verrucomicrobium sp. BvORR034]|uniref:hypothetical protein n=1 Tax=Verrucomicrobium sp. BvORR034 TaxID=1396418 RepID=UPI000678C193|nr:hypothetical protein [Verrucomicrobium sp. BvORR034]
MKIPLPILLFGIALFGSCSKKENIDPVGAKKWSETADAQLRKKVAVYTYQRPDSSWVYISTAKLIETSSGLVADNVEIQDSGYFVYPGGQRVSNIHQAIEAAGDLPRGIGGADGKPPQS